MRILLLHNRYQQRGGEDLVFESEGRLLANHGHEVENLVFHNDNIKNSLDKLTASVGSIYNFNSSSILKKKIKEFKPDVIHVHNFFYLASPSIFFTATKLKVPIVLTLHNYRLICPSTTLFYNNNIYEKSINKIFPLDAFAKGVFRNSRLETAVLIIITGFHKLINTWNRNVTYYIALTTFAKNIFQRSSLNVDAEKILVKPNFVEDHGFNLSKREKFYLFIGRLAPEKGIKNLIAAAEQLPEINFRIIGDGPLRSFVEKAAEKNKNIVYLGFQNKEFIVGQLKTARALIFPSLWYEGFPMTILEAFSCGTPVIASDLGASHEIIRDGKNGILFDYKDPEQLAIKIADLHSDDILHQQLCEHTRKVYEDLYTPEKNYHLLMHIYQQAIDKNKEMQ